MGVRFEIHPSTLARELLRFRDEAGDALADPIDVLTMHQRSGGSWCG